MAVKSGFNGHLSEFGSLAKLTFLNRFSAAAFAAMKKVTEELHPKDFIAAQKFQRCAEYVEATKRELLAQLKNGSFEIISEDQVPQGTNVINTRFVYCDKTDGMTQENIIKARLVARGTSRSTATTPKRMRQLLTPSASGDA